jgi:DNA-binding MarR family transcriptional regulator
MGSNQRPIDNTIRNLREEQIDSIYQAWRRGQHNVEALARVLYCNIATIKHHIAQFEAEKRERDIEALREEAAKQERHVEELYWQKRMVEDAHKWAGQTRTILDRSGNVVAGYSYPKRDDGVPDVIGTYGRR